LYAGFGPSVLTRSIVENIPFRAIHGFSIDSGLALDLESNGIKQFVDLSVRTQHLKVDESPEWFSNLQVGLKSPYMKFEPAENRTLLQV
jgi:hypothetical protein